jgi:hypothetical protein
VADLGAALDVAGPAVETYSDAESAEVGAAI